MHEAGHFRSILPLDSALSSGESIFGILPLVVRRGFRVPLPASLSASGVPLKGTAYLQVFGLSARKGNGECRYPIR